MKITTLTLLLLTHLMGLMYKQGFLMMVKNGIAKYQVKNILKNYLELVKIK